jgi:mannose-6-phosphate isomerase-like protein (cupin superfamily)
MKPVRRVVTGHRAGKGVVLFDGPAPNARLRRASGLVSTLLWVTDQTPADIVRADDRSAREIGVPPPPGGTIFRVVDFPPERGARSRDAILREMGVAPGGAARHHGMHRTRSVDYAVVLEGEIDMLLDDSEVHLEAGDVLVQQGTDHAWVNRGAVSCRIAFVLIDAEAFSGEEK